MTNFPRFLTVSEQEKILKFQEISAYCESHLTQALEDQASDTPWSVNAALDPANHNRNRYSNVLPWDKTRVILPCSKYGSDYTNASLVQLSRNTYIAAQGPTKNTIHHFWAMCHSQAEKTKSSIVFIAMVTPLVEQNREKCVCYWPSKHDGTLNFTQALRADGLQPNELTVTWMGEDYADDMTVTKFNLQSGDSTKTVYHYYYSGWKDTQTPDSVLPLFSISRFLSVAKKSDPNIVPIVHCSAGVGRTGTFIAVDHFLNTDLASNPAKDLVFETVKNLRDSRMMMVQTIHQYRYLYQVAKELWSARQAS